MEMTAAVKRHCAPLLKQPSAQTQSSIQSCSRMTKTVRLAAALEEEEWAAITADQAGVADIRKRNAWTERKYWNRCRARPAAACLKFPASRQWKRFMLRLKKICAINTAWDIRRTGPIPAKAFIKSASRQNKRTLWSTPERNITGDSNPA